MIIGESPGFDDDHTGRPFQGKGGRLLKEELVRAGIAPEECYITHTVKCAPPGDSEPKAPELKACRKYLESELAEVKPEYVIALGRIASKAVLKETKITEVHGQIKEFKDLLGSFKGMAAFSPNFCLRDPSKLPILRKDLGRVIGEVLGKKKEVRAPFKWREVNDENIHEFYRALINCEWFSFDLETSGLDWFNPKGWITCLNMSFDRDGGTWVLPMTMPFSPYAFFDRQKFIIRKIARLLKDGKKKGCAHNGKFDNHWLWRIFGVLFPLHFDTMLASHCIDENRAHALDSLATSYLDAPYYDIPLHWKQGQWKPGEGTRANVRTVYRYGAKDAYYTLTMRPIMEKELRTDPQVFRLFRRLVMRAARAFHRIEDNGLYVIRKRFVDTRKQVVIDRDAALVDLNCMAGKVDVRSGVKRKINWNSPQQVAKLLFEKLKLPVIERTETGAPSTGENTLIALKNKHPVANALVKYRELDKFLGTYLDGWKSLMHKDRVYFSYKLHGTVTGRYSSRLHQTPRDKRIRTTVSAPDGWTFVQGDFSQAELRIAAILSGDLEMLRCFAEGIDIHWKTLMYVIQSGGVGEYVKHVKKTARVLAGKKVGFNDAIELVLQAGHKRCIEIWDGWKEARKKAKGINFGFVYGMRENKFIEYAKANYDFEPTQEEARLIRRAYFQLYRGLEPWHEKMRKLVRLDGSVRSLSGRLRRLPGVSSSDRSLRSECERQAINSPVQGYIGDHKAMALVELADKLDWNRSRLVGEVHDSLLFWVRTELLAEELPKIAAIMRDPELLKEFKIDLPVKIEPELEVGDWGAGKEWKMAA
jgi:DNA polymerase-1